MTVSVSTLELLSLLRRPGVGPRAAVKTIEEAGASRSLREGFTADREAAQARIEECEKLGIGVVGWFDDAFPRRLRLIPDPPAILYYRGEIAIANGSHSVAIVGTREPTTWGQRATQVITDRFAREGWTVVSGLALGVDTVAHERALGHHAPTIAVLGNGLASVYPASNRALAERIVGMGGLLLAEVPPSARVEARALVKRDRLQSGLALLTVICQGGLTSGAMHTARYAAEQNRPLYVAALPRGDEPIGKQDEGTQALLTEPATRLPELLSPWRSATRRATAKTGPVALPLDESVLAQIDALAISDELGYEPPSLF